LLTLATLVALALWLRTPRTAPAAGPVEVPRAALEVRNGRIYRPGETAPFTGVMVEFYPDGARLSRSVVVEGHLHGLSEGWHPDGQLQVREHFVHGLSHGERVKWHANGATQSLAVIVEGQLHGPFRRWHENGALAEELTMNRSQPDGLARAFYPSGHLKSRVRLENGRVVEQQFWPEGTQRAEDQPVHVAATAAPPAAR
jgi:antitoxin component YwqK of YwqJK toxin-antitoxin module